MKRLGNVFDALCNRQNLLAAFAAVQRGKRRRPDIVEWRENLDERLEDLGRELRAGEFKLGNYKSFKVYDPKERTIHAAPVRERVIHHAIINVFGERLEHALIDDSFACRRGKGQLRAVWRAQEFAKKHPWCLKLDIKSYFDSIDHEILLGLLERKLKDRRLLALLHELVESYSTTPGKGLPIGNLTSQYFANLYLDGFDRLAVGRKDFSYLRYMDDMLVFGNHSELKEFLLKAKDYLGQVLHLAIKGGGALHRISPGGVEFLGYRVKPECILLNRRSKLRFKRRLTALDALFASGKCTEKYYQSHATALFAFVRCADSYHFRMAVLGKQPSTFSNNQNR